MPMLDGQNCQYYLEAPQRLLKRMGVAKWPDFMTFVEFAIVPQFR
jgi:hypothetical protein